MKKRPKVLKKPTRAAQVTSLKSRTLDVHVSRSLHAALQREADAEKVSLNELVVGKLSVGLKMVLAG